MHKKIIYTILSVIFLLICFSSCVKRAPNYLGYQSHSFIAKGHITYDGSETEIVVSLEKEISPQSICIRNGSIEFTAPSELSDVTIIFSDDGTYISSGDIRIPIYAANLEIPNIISSLFSFEQSDISGITTKNDNTGIVDIIDVKNELLSAQIHIDHESFLPIKITADIDSDTLIFDISSIEFTDTEENNDQSIY